MQSGDKPRWMHMSLQALASKCLAEGVVHVVSPMTIVPLRATFASGAGVPGRPLMDEAPLRVTAVGDKAPPSVPLVTR